MSLLDALNQMLDSKRGSGIRDREKGSGNKSTPSVERLESLCLLTTLQTITLPPVSIGPIPTNFGNGADAYEGPQAYNGSIPLFDPSLGTLVAVHVTGSAQIDSQIGVENLSHSSATTATETTAGNFEDDGVGTTPITGSFSGPAQSASLGTFDGTIDYSGTSGHTFAPSTQSATIDKTLTSAADLAFFTASPGRTTTTPTLSAFAHSNATAPGGNLSTSVRTAASGQLTISYQYIPACPSVVSVVRYGVHREHTQIIVTYSGKVDPALASNASNYQLVRRGANGQFTPTRATIVPIKEVVFNPNTNTATIVPVRSINVHQRVQLTVKSPVFNCPDDMDYKTVLGGKSGLGGFVYHHSGRFFSVHNGKLQLPQTSPPPGFLTNL
jgi:hypothetical protein